MGNAATTRAIPQKTGLSRFTNFHTTYGKSGAERAKLPTNINGPNKNLENHTSFVFPGSNEAERVPMSINTARTK